MSFGGPDPQGVTDADFEGFFGLNLKVCTLRGPGPQPGGVGLKGDMQLKSLMLKIEPRWVQSVLQSVAA